MVSNIARPRYCAALALLFLFSFWGETVAAPNPHFSPFEALWIWMPFILSGFLLNLIMSSLAAVLGIILGGLLGIAQLSTSKVICSSSVFVTQVFRNTPWIIILFAVMLLVPFELKLGTRSLIIPDWLKATVGFAIPVSANVAEVVRGAILSVPSGQWESSESLGFSKWQTLRMVILPQCVKRMMAPWMNAYAILVLSTPIAAVLGVHEAVGNAQQAMEALGARTSLLVPFYSFILVLFFFYIYPISRLTLWLERRYAVYL